MSTDSRRRSRTTRGGALLAVLWLSAGLAAIALSVSSNVRSEIDRVSTSGEGLRASYLASGALERGILWIQWGFSGQTFPAADGLPRFWTYNTRRLTMRFPSGDALVEVIPETAKLDINRATPEDLYRVDQRRPRACPANYRWHCRLASAYGPAQLVRPILFRPGSDFSGAACVSSGD